MYFRTRTKFQLKITSGELIIIFLKEIKIERIIMQNKIQIILIFFLVKWFGAIRWRKMYLNVNLIFDFGHCECIAFSVFGYGTRDVRSHILNLRLS